MCQTQAIACGNYLQINAFSDPLVVEQENALQRKAIGGITKMVRETTGGTRPGLTLKMLISTSIGPFLCDGRSAFY